MTSLIFSITARALLPVLLLVSGFLLLRGHQAPGGGFAGGLLAAGAVALYTVAATVEATRRRLPLAPRSLIGLGLLAALASGLLALMRGKPFLTAQWASVPVPFLGLVDLGTLLLFDVGVYLTVIGVTVMMILSLAGE